VPALRHVVTRRLSNHLRAPLLRNAYALMSSTALSSGIGLVYWLLAARLLSPRTVGLGSATISGMTFLAGVASLGLTFVILRFLPVAGWSSRRLLLICYAATAGTAVVAAAVFIGGLSIWTPALQYLRAGIVPAALFVLTTAIWNVFRLQDDALAALRRSVWIPVENAAYALLKVLFLVVFAVLSPTYTILVSWAIPAAAGLIPINFMLFRRFIPAHIADSPPDAMPLRLRPILSFLTGTYAGSVFYLAWVGLLPVIVTQDLGARANAFFYPPWIITTSLAAFATSMQISLLVEGARDEARLEAYTRRALLASARILVPVVVVLLPAAPLVLFFFGHAYMQHGSDTLRLLALGLLPNAVVSIYMAGCQVLNRVLIIALLPAAECALVLTLSVALLPRAGTTGVGLAWMLTEATLAAGILLGPLRHLWWPHVPGSSGKDSNRPASASPNF